MQRLKRVFAIEIETCQRCGGKLKVIASIEDAELIGRILKHRAQRGDDDIADGDTCAIVCAARPAGRISRNSPQERFRYEAPLPT
jgi:hypothetical protein